MKGLRLKYVYKQIRFIPVQQEISVYFLFLFDSKIFFSNSEKGLHCIQSEFKSEESD